ncbi:hypothetical protein Slin15195_G074100 [Septoria linicola]|uniref:Uncharacterized protein n=1 Tax=Septoria linicola TaxID=215465 RepID=A0A9Q9EJT0_9PEZI|nr:hypothetical protein Slin15195_G074100 [Septoria linicola]
MAAANEAACYATAALSGCHAAKDFVVKHGGAKTAVEGKAGVADAYALLLRSFQGKDEFVAEWLRLVNKRYIRPEDALVEEEGLEWPAETLTGHVKAKLYWHKSPEPTVEAVFAVMQKDHNMIFLGNAFVALGKWLRTPYCPVYPSEAFDRYQEIGRMNGKGKLAQTRGPLVPSHGSLG